MTTLIDIFNDLKPHNIELGKFYPATVIENNDAKNHPDKMPLGRIQFRILHLFDGIEDDQLPWAVSMLPRLQGGANNGTFAVPVIGTKVFIQFQSKDLYNPFYFPYPYSSEDQLSLVADEVVEYPKKYVVYSFASGNFLFLNTDYTDEPLQDLWSLNNVGNMKLNCDKSVDMHILKNMVLEITDKVLAQVIPDLTSIEVQTLYSFHAQQEAKSVYSANKIEEVQGKAYQNYFDKVSTSFGKGCDTVIGKEDYNVTLLGSNLNVNSDSTINCVTNADTTISADILTLLGNKIYRNAPLDFLNGPTEEAYLTGIVNKEIKKAIATFSAKVDQAITASKAAELAAKRAEAAAKSKK